MSTDYHAAYLAHELTRRHADDSVEKLTAALIDAQVHLNPHQIDPQTEADKIACGRKHFQAIDVNFEVVSSWSTAVQALTAG